MSRAIRLLPLWAFMVCSRVNFTLTTYTGPASEAVVPSACPCNETSDPSSSSYIYHDHISIMELGHLLTCSNLMWPEASSKVCHGSFCQLGSSVSLPLVNYYKAFHLHVSSFSCIPAICPTFELFLTPLQFVICFVICQVYPAVFLIDFIPAADILLVSLALTLCIWWPFKL
jgi:hypothetical protein